MNGDVTDVSLIRWHLCLSEDTGKKSVEGEKKSQRTLSY